MNSSSTQPSTPGRDRHTRVKSARNALLWLLLVVFAFAPVPWW
jgi:hypothetical protein